MDKFSFSGILDEAPPADFLFRKLNIVRTFFKSTFEVVLEKSLESLFTECRNYVSCMFTRCTILEKYLT